ncbi:hypothetical protein OPV22_013326 [Ensete ventricosum]|uniref:Uncharacterized protein n=1 Tax=Ensete ventricosum TaxID=4639 RepID=A0AAV8R818_ENSVE|nr:hypothetical protein OPV22_013326 [Ensete ventricosum]
MVVPHKHIRSEIAMDGGLASVWGFDESIEELKHKLICAAAEREELRISTRNELQKANETIRRLMDLLEVRTHERDEARRKLQLLLNQTIQPTTVELPILPLHLPLDVPQRGQSRGSSPADAVDSPQLSSMNMGDSCDDMGISRELMFSAFKAMSSARLAMKRPLPERGRFQQAVLGAGPLLLNLIFPQSQVASASVTARDSPGLEQTSFPNPEGLIPCPLSSTR